MRCIRVSLAVFFVAILSAQLAHADPIDIGFISFDNVNRLIPVSPRGNRQAS
jgi:hypothetical protein